MINDSNAYGTGNRDVFVAALTANVLKDEDEHCKAVGMDDYLSKPVPLSMLKAALDKWLPLAEVKTAGAAAPDNDKIEPSSMDPDIAEVPVWDATTLTRMVGDKPAMHRRVLEKFLVDARGKVSAILSAVAAGDTPTAGNIAHALKSSARTVGAMQLGELCQKMELAGRAGDGQSCHALAERLSMARAAAEEKIRQGLNSTELS